MQPQFSPLTDGARRVLELAKAEARSLKHSQVGTEHLLLGLLQETYGISAAVLADAGMTLPNLRSALAFLVTRGEGEAPDDPDLTASSKKVIELANEEAHDFGRDYIGTGHLLLGLSREDGGIAAGVLRTLDLTYADLRRRVEFQSTRASPETSSDTSPRLINLPFDPFATRRPFPVRGLDPWPTFGSTASVSNLDEMLTDLGQVSDEIAYRRYASGTGYECGIIRFRPVEEGEPRHIRHSDKDVVCQVLRGNGQRRIGVELVDLKPATICRIPSGTPHDFRAMAEDLILLYFSIATR